MDLGPIFPSIPIIVTQDANAEVSIMSVPFFST